MNNLKDIELLHLQWCHYRSHYGRDMLHAGANQRYFLAHYLDTQNDSHIHEKGSMFEKEKKAHRVVLLPVSL